MSGFFRKVFGGAPSNAARKVSPSEEQIKTMIEEAYGLIQKFAAIMEEGAGVIEDEGLLPATKEKMKLAFQLMLKIEKNSAQREWLSSGYVMLGSFLPLTVAEKLILAEQSKLMKEGAELRAATPDRQKAIMAATAAVMPAYMAILERSQAETDRLRQELSAVT